MGIRQKLLFLCSALSWALLAFSNPALGNDDLKQKLLDAHGIDEFDKVGELQFTFVVKNPDVVAERHYTWNPKTGEVTLRDRLKNESVTYNRNELDDASSEAIISADKKFINDSFWLSPPLHLSWSDDPALEDKGMVDLPIGEGEARLVTLSYPAEGGGYTPGDAYDLYLNDDFRPVEWAFRKGGQEEAGLVCTWDAYRKLGPLYVSTDHKAKEGPFQLQFKDLMVRLEGDAGWQPAEQPE